jgi:hypothetical protein
MNSVKTGAGLVVFVVFAGVVVVAGVVDSGATVATAFNLSLENTVNPAMGMLEIFFNLTVASGAGGWYPDTSTGGLVTGGVVLPFPKGLNCEKKFVPGVSLPVGFAGFWKYKKPKTAIIITTRTIIKSIKFLRDIKIYFDHMTKVILYLFL